MTLGLLLDLPTPLAPLETPKDKGPAVENIQSSVSSTVTEEQGLPNRRKG